MLKPCPFCGRKAEVAEIEEKGRSEPFYISCNHSPSCYLWDVVSFYPNTKGLKSFWNKRGKSDV